MELDVDRPLVITNLVKRYGDVTALDGIDLSIPRGVVFCLLGPNGAGKTTTLGIAQGTRKPTSGTVRLFGQDPRKASSALKRKMGVLPQTFSAFQVLTVRENLQYVADIYNVHPDIPRLLEDFGLSEYADKKFQTLSGGTKRRVGIAIALVNDPDLVFLDEPTAGVDPASRRKLWDVVARLRGQGRSIILTTHYMDEAERLADQVAIINKGKVIAQGTPEKVRLEYGGKTVIRLTGLEGPLPESVAKMSGVVQNGNGEASITVDASAAIPGVISLLVNGGATFKEISIREPNLDDAFVEIVGRAHG